MFRRIRRALKLLNRFEKMLDAREVATCEINNELSFNLLCIRCVQMPGNNISLSFRLNGIEKKKSIYIAPELNQRQITDAIIEMLTITIANHILAQTETCKAIDAAIWGR